MAHPDEGTIITGTLSACCNTSVSLITLKPDDKKHDTAYYICNNCGCETTPNVKDLWQITDKGKYRKI